jgi:hypothetical protein
VWGKKVILLNFIQGDAPDTIVALTLSGAAITSTTSKIATPVTFLSDFWFVKEFCF